MLQREKRGTYGPNGKKLPVCPSPTATLSQQALLYSSTSPLRNHTCTNFAQDVVWKTMQWLLWTFALLNIGYWVEPSLKAKWSQIRGVRELDRAGTAISSPSIGDVVGRLEIPRLSLSAVVFEGADPDVLERGAGHLPGSALPGDRGNTVLAAHRDTFFRSLRGIRVGDVVKIHRLHKDSAYVVQS